jgi:hypothetical protein
MLKTPKMGDLFNSERGQIVGACLAGESVTRIMGRQYQERGTVGKNQH